MKMILKTAAGMVLPLLAICASCFFPLLARGAPSSEEEALCSATINYQPEEVKKMLAAGVSPLALDHAIREAAGWGRLDMLKLLLASGKKENALHGPLGNELLHLTVGRQCEDSADVVKYLLSKGADPESEDAEGYRPIHRAAKFCHPACVKLLLGEKVNPRAVDKKGQTPLHCVGAWSSRPMAISWMGSEESLEAHLKGIEMWEVASRLDIAKQLLEAGALKTALNSDGETPSVVAKKLGHKELADYLESGAFPKLPSPDALFLEEIRHHNNWAAKLLLSIGAKANAVDANGRQAIHIAAMEEFTQAAQLLMDAGAKVDAQDKDGLQPIHHAARSAQSPRSRGMMVFLLHAGAKADAVDKEGRQPLHWLLTESLDDRAKRMHSSADALARCEWDVAEVLIAAGASPLTPNKAGETPLDLARKTGRKALAAWFEKAGEAQKK